MKNTLMSVAAAGALVACGGGGVDQTHATPPTPSAGPITLTVGQTISRTTAEVASLATVANFVTTGLTTTNGTYANCSYDTATNTLTVTPKVANTETATDTCTATFVDATGKTLGPVNVNLKDIDNKAPVLGALTPLATTAGVTWNQVLPAATDAGTITYSMKRADGTVIPLTGSPYTFDPATRTLSGDTTVTATETLTYMATDAASNASTQSLSNTVDHLGTASISGPASSIAGPITLTLSANDIDGITSWTIKHTRYRADGTAVPVDTDIIDQSGSGNPPANITVNKFSQVGQTVKYIFTITDTGGHQASSPEYSVLGI